MIVTNDVSYAEISLVIAVLRRQKLRTTKFQAKKTAEKRRYN
ncbi:MAG: hypothetical protein ACI97K_001860 [Glaciecola sp.]|jgi:hypothetical protein